jgi:predicted nucleic acid-binding Zn ribbon protein
MAKTKLLTKDEMYQENIIGVKHVNASRNYRSCGGLAGVQDYITKEIKRVQYLKICWNCGSAYESNKFNSYACSDKCKQNIIYKLKRGIKPPARMDLHMKAKNIERLKKLYGYL